MYTAASRFQKEPFWFLASNNDAVLGNEKFPKPTRSLIPIFPRTTQFLTVSISLSVATKLHYIPAWGQPPTLKSLIPTVLPATTPPSLPPIPLPNLPLPRNHNAKTPR